MKNKQTLSSSVFVFFLQAKSEPRAAAPSAGPALHLQPPQPTSSQASTLTNTVRIEKLSDEEDEEVDITDDLSDDGEGDCKPPAVLKTEPCEPEQLTGTEIQPDTEEQKEADLTETKDQPGRTSLNPQSPEPSSSFPCSEKTGVLDEKVSLPPKILQTEAPTDSEQMTDENEGQSSQSESSAQTGQLEEGCSDGTGKTHTCCFYVNPPHDDLPAFYLVKFHCGCICFPDSADKTEQSPAAGPEENQEEEDEEEEELKAPEQEIEMDMETITEDEKQAIPEFFEGRPSKTPERYLKIRNYILDQW